MASNDDDPLIHTGLPKRLLAELCLKYCDNKSLISNALWMVADNGYTRLGLLSDGYLCIVVIGPDGRCQEFDTIDMDSFGVDYRVSPLRGHYFDEHTVILYNTKMLLTLDQALGGRVHRKYVLTEDEYMDPILDFSMDRIVHIYNTKTNRYKRICLHPRGVLIVHG